MNKIKNMYWYILYILSGIGIIMTLVFGYIETLKFVAIIYFISLAVIDIKEEIKKTKNKL